MKQASWQSCNVPIKLNGNDDSDPFEEEIDRLRQQKEMQQKLKQEQAAIHDHNKKVTRHLTKTQEIRQKIVQDILPKHKGLKLAYDYDGTYMLAKDLTQVRSNQRPEIHKITQVDTVFQPSKPTQQAVIENQNLKKEQIRVTKSKTNPPQIFEASMSKPFEGFLPNQGVKLIYQDSNQEVVKCQDIRNWGDGQRMTKKEFEAIKGEGQRTMNNSIKQQMLQQINSDIVDPKNTPANFEVTNQKNDLQISQSYSNLRETHQKFQQQQQVPQTAKNRKQGSIINVADKNLLDLLLS